MNDIFQKYDASYYDKHEWSNAISGSHSHVNMVLIVNGKHIIELSYIAHPTKSKNDPEVK